MSPSLNKKPQLFLIHLFLRDVVKSGLVSRREVPSRLGCLHPSVTAERRLA